MAKTKSPKNSPSGKKAKKALSAYTLFYKDEYQVLKESNPDLKFNEFAKLVADSWRQLDEEAKKPYVASAAALKQAALLEAEAL